MLKKSKTMKTKSTIIIALATLMVTITGCEKSIIPIKGNGNVTTETRSMSSFNRIDNEGSFDVYIIQDSIFEVTIEAESNLISHINTDINGSILEIDTRDNLKTNHPIKVYVRTPNIHGVALSGSGLVDMGEIYTTNLDVGLSGSGSMRGSIAATEVLVEIGGSGSVNLGLICNSITTYIGGSGDVFLNGSSNTSNYNISGSGAVKAYNFEVKNCYTKISGSGDMYINVADQLGVNISGSGSIHYIGYPSIDKSITGSGNLINEN